MGYGISRNNSAFCASNGVHSFTVNSVSVGNNATMVAGLLFTSSLENRTVNGGGTVISMIGTAVTNSRCSATSATSFIRGNICVRGKTGTGAAFEGYVV